MTCFHIRNRPPYKGTISDRDLLLKWRLIVLLTFCIYRIVTTRVEPTSMILVLYLYESCSVLFVFRDCHVCRLSSFVCTSGFLLLPRESFLLWNFTGISSSKWTIHQTHQRLGIRTSTTSFLFFFISGTSFLFFLFLE